MIDLLNRLPAWGVIGVLLAFVVASTGAALLVGELLYPMPEPPEQLQEISEDMGGIPQAFVDDVAAGRAEQAYERMAAPYRTLVSLEEFGAVVEQSPYLREGGEVRIPSVSMLDQTAVGEGSLAHDGERVLAQFHAVREEDEWRLTGIRVGGLPAVPIYGAPR